jgi:hypothetical protein
MAPVLPSDLMTLAGAGKSEWKHFNDSITERAPDGAPRRGSMGLSYGLTVNICTIYEDVGRNDAAFIDRLRSIRHSREGTWTTLASARLCLRFVKWMLSDTDLFVIRKGTRAMWIARRTSTLNVEDPLHRYPLRFRYEVIQPATEAVQRRVDAKNTGQIMTAVKEV